MNAVEIRKYWSYRYQEKYDEPYKANNYAVEVILLKRLLDKYGEFVLLEAIDKFLSAQSKTIASLRYFTAKKVFENKFANLIKCVDISKYMRFLNTYSKDTQEKIKPLIEEYQDYCRWESISDKEKIRKAEIVKSLETIMSD